MDASALAIFAAVLVVCAGQLRAIVDAGRRGGWLWALIVWLTFPLGAIAWFAYGRRRSDATTAV